MRQIFSTTLAAALVFGGTLLFAGYWDREVQTVWYCPDVDGLRSGPLPDIFEEDTHLDWAAAAGLSWSRAYLARTFGLSEGQYRGRVLICEYEQQHPDHDHVFDVHWVSLVPELDAELPTALVLNGSWRQHYDRHSGAVQFSCRESPADCGFHVIAAD